MNTNKKIAVVLLNLGGPDSLEAVEPFLFNLFYDESIIRLPNPFRYLVAKIISKSRTRVAKKIYSLVGGCSPILKETKLQAEALKKKLKETEIFICMRYWHPRAELVVQKIKEYDPNQIIIVPLYPQFSTTTTGSSVKELQRILKEQNVTAEQKVLCCYPMSQGFIDAHVDLIKKEIEQESEEAIVLFSAHGLPKKIIQQGDPYQWQVEKTVGAIVRRLGLKDLDYKITYQSRVGPMEWLKPSTEEEIKLACLLGKPIIIVPITFVSEHVETLVELDIEYAKIARESNIRYSRVPALQVNKIFIEDLARNILNVSNMETAIASSSETRICPREFSGCLCKDIETNLAEDEGILQEYPSIT